MSCTFRQFLFLCCLGLMLGGCSIDWGARVNPADAEKIVQDMRDQVATLRAQLAVYDNELTAAKEAVEKSNDANARVLVERLQTAVAAVNAKLPDAERVLADSEENLKRLKESGDGVPWWQVALAVATPIALPLLSGVPVVGPIIAPIAGALANGAFKTLATPAQVRADEQAYARSAALPHQVQVTSALLKAMPPETAEPILDLAKKSQQTAGVHTTLRAVVDATEKAA